MNGKRIAIIIGIVFIVIILIVGTIIGYNLLKKQDDTVESMKITSYELGGMYANLKNSSRILKCTIVIEITDEEFTDELNNKKYLINNEINKIIRNKTTKEIEGSEGQISLQKEITDKLKEMFDAEKIYNIYFYELIVQ